MGSRAWVLDSDSARKARRAGNVPRTERLLRIDEENMRFKNTTRSVSIARAIGWGAAVLGALALGFRSGRTATEPRAAPRILGVYGVGGVIGEDGGLWQYMPDRKKWLSIDEAFRGEGKDTHILPLPVQASEVQFMESWGFLVTRKGEVWHYDLSANRWENIGPPPGAGE
jgi:hypothetical protein